MGAALATLMVYLDDPATWPGDDLIAVSDSFDASLTAAGYFYGVFPMPCDDVIGWFSPVSRGVLVPKEFRVSRSLRKSAKRYVTSIDAAFGDVIARCADPARPYGWITRDVIDVYTELFSMGLCHSVETWDCEGRLVGGLYGIVVGRVFAGESMFHDPIHGRDASKVALGRLVAEMEPDSLIDVQWVTKHLASLGAKEMPRGEYLEALAALRKKPAPPLVAETRSGAWRLGSSPSAG